MTRVRVLTRSSAGTTSSHSGCGGVALGEGVGRRASEDWDRIGVKNAVWFVNVESREEEGCGRVETQPWWASCHWARAVIR